MLKTGGGAIVNTSSIFGLNGYPGWSLYVATKHAVTGMTKAAALDYARQNIRVNAVGPGPVETPLLHKGTGGDPHSYAAFVPMGRIGQPDEIADADHADQRMILQNRQQPHLVLEGMLLPGPPVWDMLQLAHGPRRDREQCG